ncbi:ATP-binding cassette domain-containing protein [bacterium]|nr:ATP-binding cassette domain-containing protein [bacterium]
MSTSYFSLHNFSIGTLAPFSLQAQKGKIISLSGPSGCGKSRLLRAIADLDIHQGYAKLADMRCDQIPAPQWRQQIALLPTEIHWWLPTVREHFSKKQLNSPDINNCIQQLGFSLDDIKKPVDHLSSGEKQRLGLVRLLAQQPKVLLLDEPTANLDDNNKTIVEKIITDYSLKNSATIIWVTHDKQQQQQVATSHWVFNNNTVEILDTAHE